MLSAHGAPVDPARPDRSTLGQSSARDGPADLLRQRVLAERDDLLRRYPERTEFVSHGTTMHVEACLVN